MKKQIILILILFTSILSGCLLISIYPYYTKDTLVQLDGIEGKWIDKDSVVWTFKTDTTVTRDDDTLLLYSLLVDSHYLAEKKSCEKSIIIDSTMSVLLVNKYDAGITVINGAYFLDLFPDKFPGTSGLHAQHFILGHSISKIQLDKDTLFLSTMEDSWVDALSDEQIKEIGYIDSKNNNLLTASTEKLRKMIADYSDTLDVFIVIDTLLKVK